MSKPDDIPQDVWDAAVLCGSKLRFELFDISRSAAIVWGKHGSIAKMDVAIARAILKERDRCAEICDEYSRTEHEDDYMAYGGRDCAASIRGDTK